jgi:hypothetical protein
MEELTQAVTLTDKKREEMLCDLNQLEKERIASYFRLYCAVLRSESTFYTKAHSVMDNLQTVWTALELQVPPASAVSTWPSDFGYDRKSMKDTPPKARVEPEKQVEKEPTKKEKEKETKKPKKDTPEESDVSAPMDEASKKQNRLSIFGGGKKEKEKEKTHKSSKKQLEIGVPNVVSAPSTSKSNTPRESNPPAPPHPTGANSEAPVLQPTPCNLKAKAIYDYQAVRPDELDLKEGDVITVTAQQVDSWWLGTNAVGKSGVFPSTFVQVLADQGPQTPAAADRHSPRGLPPSERSVSSGAPNVLHGDWEECATEDGIKYYYNKVTLESAWELPAH